MKQRIQDLINNGHKIKAIARTAKIDYMVLFRYYKGHGRDLMPEEEARLIKIHSLYMEAAQ